MSKKTFRVFAVGGAEHPDQLDCYAGYGYFQTKDIGVAGAQLAAETAYGA
jgi:hypothetical protein